jgi:hypothetical protein
MQSTLDSIKTRTKRIYLSHPLMWRFERLYDSISRLDLVRRKTVEEDCLNDPFVKIIRDTREEKRIAKKYHFAKHTFLGYRMTKGFPLNFPDSEFEERYAARNLRS